MFSALLLTMKVKHIGFEGEYSENLLKHSAAWAKNMHTGLNRKYKREIISLIDLQSRRWGKLRSNKSSHLSEKEKRNVKLVKNAISFE